MTMLRTYCAALMMAGLMSGCLTPKSIEPTRFYTVTPEPFAAGAPASSHTLGLRPLIAARPYKLEVAYRAETNRLAYFPRSEWAELPGTLVSRALADAITQSNLFSDAGDAATMARPELIFTGELRRFEADFTTTPPHFVATISASIRNAADGGAVWRGEAESRIPLAITGPEGATDGALTEIARAASEAITALSADICTGIRGTLEASEKS